MRKTACAIGALSLFGLALAPAQAEPTRGRCFGDLSVGALASVQRISLEEFTVDHGAWGGLISPGIGCDVISYPFFAGVEIRGDFIHATGDLGPFGATSLDYQLTPFARFGVYLTKQTSLYGVAGYDWAWQSGSGLAGSATFGGPMVGAGLEHSLSRRWSAYAEYNLDLLDHKALGPVLASSGPDIHVFRVGLRYNLSGDNPAAHSVWDAPFEEPDMPGPYTRPLK